MWMARLNKLLLFATYLSTSTCQICTPEFQPNLNELVQLNYNYRSGHVDRMIIKVSDGQPFSEMFTESCRDLSKIRVDYRKAGDSTWKKYTGRRGNIQLDKKKIEIRKIMPCSAYEVKIVATLEDMTQIESQTLNFGPFYNELDEDTISENLGEESMPEITESIAYSNISSSGFTVSWGSICAQSFNFYLLPGPDFNDYSRGPYKTMTNVLENNLGNSLWISTEPCHQYKVAIESFMTKETTSGEYLEDGTPKSKDHGGAYVDVVTTDPLPETLITTSMEEGSNILSWEFTDLKDCVTDINYEIELIPESEEGAHSLQSGNWEDEGSQLDISEHTYTPCSNYELNMKISYTATSGNPGERSVFTRSFRTNHLGQFAPEGTNHLAVLEDVVSVIFETCDTEAIVALVDSHVYESVGQFTVTPYDNNVQLEKINELKMPCVNYNVILKGLDGEELNSEALSTKKPQGKVTFNLTEYSTGSLEFSVDDIEENSRCEVNKYQVTCQDTYDSEGSGNSEAESFVGENLAESFVEVTGLSNKTIYNCQAMVSYTGFEDNTDVIPSEGADFETEGFDTIEIVNGEIFVTCESRVENLQVALVRPDEMKTRVKLIDANCNEGQPINIFEESTEPCVNYMLQLFEKPKIIGVSDLSSSASDLVVFDETEFPVKPPEAHLDMELLQSEGGSLGFKIQSYIQNQFCRVESYRVTCHTSNSTGYPDIDEEDHIESSEEATIQIYGLTRERFYNCRAEVKYVVPELEEPEHIVYSEPQVVETEGFDSFQFLEEEEDSIQVNCGSNLKDFMLVLIEDNGERVGATHATCEGSNDISDFQQTMKPCGKYKVELISTEEYNNIIYMEDNGHQSDLQSVAIQELTFTVKQPGGNPELKLIKTGIDNAEFEVVDQANENCQLNITQVWCSGVENDYENTGNQSYVDIEVQCEGNSTECDDNEVSGHTVVSTGHGSSIDQSYVKVADLNDDTKYSCVASMFYLVPMAVYFEEGSRDYDSDDTNQDDNWINAFVTLTSNDVQVQTLPLPPETTIAPRKQPSAGIPVIKIGSPPSDNTPAITGAVVGVAIVLIIVTIAVVLKRKRSVNNNNLKEKDPATVKIDLAENKVTVVVEENDDNTDNTDKENNATNCEKEEKENEVIIKNGAANDVHVDMEIENVLKEKESIEDGLKESSF